jgi:hypothetical protein
LAGQIPPPLFDHGQGLHWRRQWSFRGFCAKARGCFVNPIWVPCCELWKCVENSRKIRKIRNWLG